MGFGRQCIHILIIPHYGRAYALSRSRPWLGIRWHFFGTQAWRARSGCSLFFASTAHREVFCLLRLLSSSLPDFAGVSRPTPAADRCAAGAVCVFIPSPRARLVLASLLLSSSALLPPAASTLEAAELFNTFFFTVTTEAAFLFSEGAYKLRPATISVRVD